MFGVYVGRNGTYRFVVEQAGPLWEWIMWPVGDASRGQSSCTDTRDQAMRAAAAAARRIDGDAS